MRRLQELAIKLKHGNGSAAEEDEFMDLLARNGSISVKQQETYQKDRSNKDLWKAALTIGGIVLLGVLLDKVLND